MLDFCLTGVCTNFLSFLVPFVGVSGVLVLYRVRDRVAGWFK